MNKWIKTGLAALSIFTACSVPSMASKVEYKAEMVKLISEIHEYSHAKNDNFILIGNGSTALFDIDVDNPQEQVEKLAENLDGVMAESIFYGYGMQMDNASPPSEQEEYKRLLKDVREYGLTALSLDYCTQEDTIKDSYKKNEWQSFVAWVSAERNLDTIPQIVPNKVNNQDCMKLSDIKNYMVILNPQKYHTKEMYLGKLAATDYDLLILDLYYGGVPLTREDVEKIHYKANGGKRLVVAYMSVGEAENYRYYWQSDWDSKLPDWLDNVNEDWAGSYHAKYWRPEWKAILMGDDGAYLDKIMASGFDGAFLDVVDGYQYFLEK